MKPAESSSSSRPPPLWQYGQRSLSFPLLSRPRAIGRGGAASEPNGRSVSLSEFLDRKLGNTNLGNARSVKEKESSFSSIGLGRRGIGVVDQKGKERRPGGGGSFLPDLSIFRPTEDGRSCEDPVEVDGTEGSNGSRKRSNPSVDPPGVAGSHFSGSKYLVVLGDDPKPKEKRMKHSCLERKPKPLFNHYATGRGLWDCGREGIDTEEVGCEEAWERMGSTTLGGLEWH